MVILANRTAISSLTISFKSFEFTNDIVSII